MQSSSEVCSRPCRSGPQLHDAIIIIEQRWRWHVPRAERLVARALALTGCSASIVLANDALIRKLNARDRGRNKPTNVLTYCSPPAIIVSLDTVLREAREAQKRPAHHLAHLVIHGALHLAGDDHEHAGSAVAMERREARLLSRIVVPNPWKTRP